MPLSLQYLEYLRQGVHAGGVVVFALIWLRYSLSWRIVEPNIYSWFSARKYGRFAWILVALGVIIAAAPWIVFHGVPDALISFHIALFRLFGSLLITNGGSFALTALAVADGKNPSIIWVHLAIPMVTTLAIVGVNYAAEFS